MSDQETVANADMGRGNRELWEKFMQYYSRG
jgi:hypothetical protein